MKKVVLVLIALFAIGSVAASCTSESATMTPPPAPPPQVVATPGNVVSVTVNNTIGGGSWETVKGAASPLKRGDVSVYTEGSVVEIKTSRGMIVVSGLTGGMYLVQQQYGNWQDFHAAPTSSQAIKIDISGSQKIQIRPTSSGWEAAK